MGETPAHPATDLGQMLARASDLLPAFEAGVEGIDDVPRGVLVSEIFFLFVTLGAYRPPQILESGRALGQSTFLLGRCYPETPVISIEYDAKHHDAAVALERLRALANVTCLFGDARHLMPALRREGDVAVIDGPKELRAAKLAMDLLRSPGASVVFIHDCYRGSTIRAFLERRVPWAFYSDDPRFVAQYCHLDRDRGRSVDPCWFDVERQPSDRSYAGTFACVPARRGFPRRADYWWRAVARWGDGWRHHRGRRQHHPLELEPRGADGPAAG